MSSPTTAVGERSNPAQPRQATRRFISQVYGWLALSTAFTTATAALLERHRSVGRAVSADPTTLVVVVSAAFALPLLMRRRIVNVGPLVALALHIAFAVLLGFVMSVVFSQYTTVSAARAFGAVALTFAALSAVTPEPSHSAQPTRTFATFIAVGLVFASALELLGPSHRGRPTVEWLVVDAMIVVYAVISGYETDRIDHFAATPDARGREAFRYSVQCAAVAAMDFVGFFVVAPQFVRRVWSSHARA
jgi:FtsH-binding integral membrane protein